MWAMIGAPGRAGDTPLQAYCCRSEAQSVCMVGSTG
jgi:hypothetical protein